ncbi:hypothetical protein BaRGS_00022446 [Batillaria attramentaria]|uniref:Major facilitator superfamily (MFS) profile domain-containing protein n=1 Tax=Batillaria attramentaria TaxID=370345 RepID=A0ABD0KH46_9CAEN
MKETTSPQFSNSDCSKQHVTDMQQRNDIAGQETPVESGGEESEPLLDHRTETSPSTDSNTLPNAHSQTAETVDLSSNSERAKSRKSSLADTADATELDTKACSEDVGVNASNRACNGQRERDTVKDINTNDQLEIQSKSINGNLLHKNVTPPPLNSEHKAAGKSVKDSQSVKMSASQTGLSKNEPENEADGSEHGGKSDLESENSGLPVDRGWAWVIMTAQFILTLVMVGYGRALSIFFMEFIAMFEASVTTATIGFGIMAACFGVGRFSHALLYTPCVTLLGHYFKNRRSFANAVANTGISISALAFPPLTEMLISNFGTRGAILLVGGIHLHSVAAACLLRPVEFYRKKCKPGVDAEHGESRTLDEKQTPVERIVLESSEAKETDGMMNTDDEDSQNVTSALLNHDEDVEVAYHPDLEDYVTKHYPATIPSSLPEYSYLMGEEYRCRSQSLCLRNNDGRTRRSGATKPLPVRQFSCPDDAHQRVHHHHDVLQLKPDQNHLKQVSVFSSSTYDVCGSTFSVPSEVIVQDTTTSQKLDPGTAQPEAGQPVDDECGNSCVRAVSSVVDLSMFKNWLFILIVVYAPLGLNAGFIAFYFPSLGVDKGLSRASAALLLTVVGGVDMVSRLVVGYVADLNIVKRTHLVAINLLILGMASQFTSFYSSFPLLAMYAVIYGLCAGTCQNLLVVVIIDLLGLERLGKAMGLVLVVNATCAALTHPIIGALVDASGSFVAPFHFIGGCLFLGAIALILEPVARRLEARRMRKLEARSIRMKTHDKLHSMA